MSLGGIDRPFVQPSKSLVSVPGLVQIDKQTTVYSLNKQTGEIKLVTQTMPEVIKQHFQSNGAVLPVYDPYMLRQFASMDSTHSSCIKLKVNTIAGMGYYFREKSTANNKDLMKFVKMPSGNMETSFVDLLRSIYDSYSTYGYGYIEFVKYGNMYRAYRIDSPVDVFVIPKKDANGNILKEIDHYEQVSKADGRIKKFYPFTATEASEIVNGRNYLIRYANNYKQNSFYAIPDYYSVLAEIRSNFYIQTCNRDFFQNRMHPDLVFIFTGGHLQTSNKDEIQNFYQQNTKAFHGVGNQHKTMVLSKRGKDSKIEVKELNKVNSEFNLKLKSDNDIAIARAHNCQTKLVSLSQGQGGLVGGGADIGQLFTQHQLQTKPAQITFEHFIDRFLDIVFSIDPKIKLETVDLINPKDLSIIHSLYYKNGVIGKLEQRDSIAHTGLGVKNPEEMPEDVIQIQDTTGVNDRGATRENMDTDINEDDMTTVSEDKFGK